MGRYNTGLPTLGIPTHSSRIREHKRRKYLFDSRFFLLNCYTIYYTVVLTLKGSSYQIVSIRLFNQNHKNHAYFNVFISYLYTV